MDSTNYIFSLREGGPQLNEKNVLRCFERQSETKKTFLQIGNCKKNPTLISTKIFQ